MARRCRHDADDQPLDRHRRRALTEKGTKTHQVRAIALDPITRHVLDRHREAMERRAGGQPLAPNPYIFTDRLDCAEPWHPDHVTKSFRAIRQKLDLGHVMLHDLRHFSVSQQLAAGMPVRTVAGWHGHADASVTLATYGHFIAAADEVAALVMGNLLAGLVPEAPAPQDRTGIAASLA